MDDNMLRDVPDLPDPKRQRTGREPSPPPEGAYDIGEWRITNFYDVAALFYIPGVSGDVTLGDYLYQEVDGRVQRTHQPSGAVKWFSFSGVREPKHDAVPPEDALGEEPVSWGTPHQRYFFRRAGRMHDIRFEVTEVEPKHLPEVPDRIYRRAPTDVYLTYEFSSWVIRIFPIPVYDEGYVMLLNSYEVSPTRRGLGTAGLRVLRVLLEAFGWSTTLYPIMIEDEARGFWQEMRDKGLVDTAFGNFQSRGTLNDDFYLGFIVEEDE